MCLVLFLPVEIGLKKGKVLGNKRNSCLPQFGSFLALRTAAITKWCIETELAPNYITGRNHVFPYFVNSTRNDFRFRPSETWFPFPWRFRTGNDLSSFQRNSVITLCVFFCFCFLFLVSVTFPVKYLVFFFFSSFFLIHGQDRMINAS